ncbi:MAG: hypothetical protein LBT86_07805 [Deltaproteobacteria bacterium]|jgi:ferredoxin|nr:hypothetical protein [Deltaproteobacteria bacterium]
MELSPIILAQNLKAEAEKFLAGPGNHNGHPTDPRQRAFGEPIFGYARASDPIWATFKKSVDLACLTPVEAFGNVYPDADLERLSTLVFVLPQTTQTMKEQNQARLWPAEGWARSRGSHQKTVDGLALYLLNFLKSLKILAVIPDLLPVWKTLPSSSYGITSLWSHRHAGFAAGLGTFGLCDGLITEVGKAHRMGSLIINHRLPITPRSYGDDEFHQHCLWFNSGSCGLCVTRCPAGAISLQGHDKVKCSDYLKSTTPYIATHWPDMAGTYGCGLCQSRVPCAVRTPPKVTRS